MAHINSGVIAISQTPNPTKFQKTLGVNDYYWGAPDSELPLGHIQMLGKSDRNILRAGAPWFAPGIALDYMAKHAIDFWLTTEDLPHPDNRVTRRPQRRHPPRQDATTTSSRTGGCSASSRTCSGRCGCHATRDPALVGARPADPARRHRAQVRHRALRARPGGLGRSTSNCKAHDLDNLYVVDTSFFPSSSAVNPALTAMANALRVGDHLLERLGARRRTASGSCSSRRRHEPHRVDRRSSIGKGLVAGFAGTAAMTVSSTVEARLRGRRGRAPRRRARPRRCSASRSSTGALAQARFNDLSHWGYGTGWGVVRGLLAAAGLRPRAATAAHGAAIYGAAQVTLPALEIAPPVVFWPKQEIAIDAFHHAVYAAATGLAYALIDR